MNENEELAFEVVFMSCVIDKADNLKVLSSDSHFSDFVGVLPSDIEQGRLSLYDVMLPKERENVMSTLCRKNSTYIYFDFNMKNAQGEYIYLHCTGENDNSSTLCRLTIADVSRSEKKSQELSDKTKTMHHLIDLVNGGVCLFKVNQNMHFEALYMNDACCRYFGTTKETYSKQVCRLDELIHPDDKSDVFQAIGQAMATQKPIDLELRIRTHAQNYIWCKMNSNIQRYDKDNCPIFHAIFTDINTVKEDEQQADRQSDLMVEIFKNMPGPVFCADLVNPFKLNVVSEDFMKLIGYSRKELFDKYGGHLSKLILDRDVPIARHAIEEQSKKGDTIQTTYSLKTKSGKYILVMERRKVVDGNNGEKSTIAILRDITDSHIDTSFDF